MRAKVLISTRNHRQRGSGEGLSAHESALHYSQFRCGELSITNIRCPGLLRKERKNHSFNCDSETEDYERPTFRHTTRHSVTTK